MATQRTVDELLCSKSWPPFELRQSDISQLLQLYTKWYPFPKILLQQNKIVWQLHWTRSITSYSLTTLCIWHRLCFFLAQTTKTLKLSKLQNYLNSMYLTQTIKATLVQILLIAFDVHACPIDDVSPLCSRLLFTLFRACHYCFSLFSWLILTPLCSSRISVLALDILITELSEFSQTYILTVKYVSGLIIAHVRTQGFFPAQVERSLEC